MEFKEFRNNVTKWATERKIIPNSNFKAQYVKLIEELGELALGIRKRDEELIKDSIGDVAVVLCVIGGLENVEIKHYKDVTITIDNTSINEPFYALTIKIGELARYEMLNFNDTDLIADIIMNSFYILGILSKELDTTIEECMSVAWNEIKDRKGYLREDGIFIKEADYKPYDNDIDHSYKYPTNTTKEQ